MLKNKNSIGQHHYSKETTCRPMSVFVSRSTPTNYPSTREYTNITTKQLDGDLRSYEDDTRATAYFEILTQQYGRRK